MYFFRRERPEASECLLWRDLEHDASRISPARTRGAIQISRSVKNQASTRSGAVDAPERMQHFFTPIAVFARPKPENGAAWVIVAGWAISATPKVVPYKSPAASKIMPA